MNHQLMEKVIKSDESSACPPFTYENPILDRNIAKALSRSFVKILRFSQQDSKINKHLRHSVLTNIRKLCQLEPEDHEEIEENIKNLLTETYLKVFEEKRKVHSTDLVERRLDEFLVKNLAGNDLKSKYEPSFKAETMQSLLNLRVDSVCMLTDDLLNYHGDDKSLTLAKNIWNSNEIINKSTLCNISLKMKSEIESQLLSVSETVIANPNIYLNTIFTTKDFVILLQNCSKSSECFQICISILNYLYFTSNFNQRLLQVISDFIIKIKMSANYLSTLYPKHLRHIVVLLDFDVNTLPNDLKLRYIEETKKYLKIIHSQCETDLLLLLSHFPQWFDVYFSN